MTDSNFLNLIQKEITESDAKIKKFQQISTKQHVLLSDISKQIAHQQNCCEKLYI